MMAVIETLRVQGRAVTRELRQNSLVIVLVAVALWLILVPLGQLIISSFQSGTVTQPGGWTLANYVTAYRAPITYAALVNTLIYASAGTFLSLAIAVCFAWLIERTDLPWRNAAWTLLLVPMAMPGLLFAMGWIFLLEPRIGLINVGLRSFLAFFGFGVDQGPLNIHSLAGLIFLDGLRGVTTIFLMIAGAFRMMDPALEESARASGATGAMVMRRITWPLLLPAIFAGGMYSFMASMDSFEVPMIVGLPGRIFVFSTLVYFSAQGMYPPNYGLAGAFAVSFLLISLFLVYLNRRYVGHAEKYVTITGKGYRPRVAALGRWRYPAFGLFVIYASLTVLAPLAMLVWTSLLPFYQVPSISSVHAMTWNNYVRIVQDPRNMEATLHTLAIATGAATAVMVLSLAIAWVVTRTRVAGRSLLDGISFLPQAIPSVIIALALVYLYARPPLSALPIFGSIWIIILGLTASYLAFGTRTMNGAVIQVGRELEEAAEASGATRAQVLAGITLPLVLPAFAGGWVWVAVHATRAFSIPLILSSANTEVLAVRLFNLWESGDSTQASALGVMLIFVLTLVMILGRWIGVRRSSMDR
jgi:iron(III) transport system permease protein